MQPSSDGLFFDRIVKSFGGTQALRGVSLTVGRGEIVALLGENGAGKSTLIKVLGGIHRPDEGGVRIDGVPYAHEAGKAGGQKVAFIHQDLGLIEWMSVAENIALALGYVRNGPQDRLGRDRGGGGCGAAAGRGRVSRHGPGVQPDPHREIAGRHCPGAGGQQRFSGAGRADRQPARRRGGAAVRRAAPAEGAGRGHDLCQPPAGRDLPHRRPRGGAARRADGRHAPDRPHDARGTGQPDRRAQGARDRAARRSGRPRDPDGRRAWPPRRSARSASRSSGANFWGWPGCAARGTRISAGRCSG